MIDAILKQHRSQIWFANQLHQDAAHSDPTGFSNLDHALHGGWPASGCIELSCTQQAIGEFALLLPALQTQLQNDHIALVINLPGHLNPHPLVEAGIDLKKVAIINCDPASALWCAEQSLKSGCCRTVILWASPLSVTQAKRLQLAAQENHSRIFVLTSASSMETALPIACRLILSPSQNQLHIRVAKQKGLPSSPVLIDVFQFSQPGYNSQQQENISANHTGNIVRLHR
ncbi:translesion DNA synthesis-associated protein ImuA [Parasalinivibrio latis]|uniref:translesion DNA synthesis-associated protein ImuA n=1 Tax=Parasalinivibrio latis TaxID=2952610 RepID=UPI0030DFDAF9